MFFESLFGDDMNRERLPGCPFFRFLFPFTMEVVEWEDCGHCKHSGQKKPLDPLPIKILGVPIPDNPAPDESLQQLVDAATAPTRVTGPCSCRPDCGCRAEVGKTTRRFLLTADALIVKIQRIDYDLPEEIPVLAPGEIPKPVGYRNNRRKVHIQNILKVPSLDGLHESSMQFELCAAIEHSGSIGNLTF